MHIYFSIYRILHVLYEGSVNENIYSDAVPYNLFYTLKNITYTVQYVPNKKRKKT